MLWAFGDSFITEFRDARSWLFKISNHLNTPVRSLSVPGSSVSYTINTFENRIKDFNFESDLIIIGLTSCVRTYFLKDYPHISQPHQLDQSWVNNNFDPEIKTAMNLHTKFFSDVVYESNMALTKSFLYRLDFLSAKMKHKIVVLSCFDDTFKHIINHGEDFKNLIIPDKCLFELSTEELEKNNYDKLYDRIIDGHDPRTDHLTFTNHEVFYQKLKEAVDNQENLKLTDGFVKGIITLELSEDRKFVEKEFSDYYGIYSDKFI